MYSLVLMAALSGAPATQGWHHHWQSCYCNGCCGYSGHGSCGCYGYYNCGGVWGGHGGCYGCWGYPWYADGTSGTFGWPTFQCHGCYGCYGGYSCYGMPTGNAIVETAPTGPVNPGTPRLPPQPRETKPGKVEETPPPREEKKKGGDEQARARVIIEAPADAKVYVDDSPVQVGAGRRVFQTPLLNANETYFYDIRVEIIRDGRPITSNQRLVVRSGQTVTASFAGMDSTRDAAARAER